MWRREVIEGYPRWVFPALALGLAVVAQPPGSAVDVLCLAWLVFLAYRWAVRPRRCR